MGLALELGFSVKLQQLGLSASNNELKNSWIYLGVISGVLVVVISSEWSFYFFSLFDGVLYDEKNLTIFFFQKRVLLLS